MNMLTTMSTTPLFTSAPPPTTTRDLPPPDKLAVVISNSKSTTQLDRIHAALYRHNLLHQQPILNFHLLRAYSSLDRLDYSVTLFNQTHNPNIFLYTAIIHCHAQHNLHEQALLYYSQMLARNIEPNAFTFSSILKSCPLKPGIAIHSHTIKFGLDKDLYVRTCLVDVYARGGDVLSAQKLFDNMSERNLVSITTMLSCYTKHGDIAAARLLFDGMQEKDVVCWNVMIDGYTQHGLPNEALVLFRRMLAARVKPNEITVVAVLSACGQIGALESGYAIHGSSKDALQLFNEMCGIGVRPTHITFIGILNACAHAGLVNEGWRLFNSMQDDICLAFAFMGKFSIMQNGTK
ncbi:hypothetical protein QYF36_019220 [Acer negundo]|nr:hypothetical protein QYF36_019220 [Acer negundo]